MAINALLVIGGALITLGAILNVIGTIGLLRFPNFFIRIHAATVAVIGGCVLPMVGVAILAFGVWEGAGIVTSLGAIATAIFIFITLPVSSHAMARAAARMNIPREPLDHDHLKEDKG